jgi:TetR/AcrR family transcriptional regulator
MGIRERKEREKEARRDEIVKAAEMVFREKGLADSTMDDIASAAELSKGTLYLYYKNKEDLFAAVAMKGSVILAGMFQDVVDKGGHPLVVLSELSKAYVEYYESHNEYYRMGYLFDHYQVALRLSEEMVQECLTMNQRIWDLVSNVFSAAINAGYVDDRMSPVEAGIIAWANIDGMLRLLDKNEQSWIEKMGLDVTKMLQNSGRYLLEGMMTEKGRKAAAQLFPEWRPRTLRRFFGR